MNQPVHACVVVCTLGERRRRALVDLNRHPPTDRSKPLDRSVLHRSRPHAWGAGSGVLAARGACTSIGGGVGVDRTPSLISNPRSPSGPRLSTQVCCCRHTSKRVDEQTCVPAGGDCKQAPPWRPSLFYWLGIRWAVDPRPSTASFLWSFTQFALAPSTTRKQASTRPSQKQ